MDDIALPHRREREREKERSYDAGLDTAADHIWAFVIFGAALSAYNNVVLRGLCHFLVLSKRNTYAGL